MAMNQWLAEMYGTGAQAEEAQEKVAELELFAKLAADNGIDLTTLEPEQVATLYAETFGKVAQEGEEEEDDEDEAPPKKEKESDEEKEKESAAQAAVAEHEAAKEGAAKFAEADIMGRTMAHAFVNELEEIDKEAAGKVEAAKKGAKKLYGAAAKKAKQVARKEKGVSKGVGERLMAAGSKAGKKVGLLKKNLKGSAGTKRTVGRAALAAGALGGAGAAYGAGKALQRKESSALDILAAEEAVKIAEAGGWDTDECVDLLEKVLTEGPGESEKIAFVEDTADAITVRGFELLEKCGYAVNWEAVFGGGEAEADEEETE